MSHRLGTRYVVALAAEARPLVDRLRLRGVADDTPFPLYRGAGDEDTWLVVSGIGKTAAAAATGYLFQTAGGARDRPWLNVGIGGHRDRPVGEGLLAHRVTDVASGRSWYPPRVFEAPCATAGVMTVDRPERAFKADAVYDMEAAGFFEAAGRFATAELVHSFKVVSDNLPEDPSGPPPRFTTGQVGELLTASLETVLALAGEVESLAGELAALRESPREFEALLARWRFSLSQQRQLRRQLERWQLLLPEAAAGAALEGCTSARQVLERLEERLATAALAAASGASAHPGGSAS